jgi:cysteine desulfurase
MATEKQTFSRCRQTCISGCVRQTAAMEQPETKRAIYLDYNATTPVDPEVMEVVRFYMMEEFGNAGSRTHEYGARAKKAVENAREVIATELGVRTGDVIFTSGATESNNLAILGLEAEGRRTGRMHLISSQIEHKAVLEPLAELERRGFSLTLLPPDRNGVVPAAALQEALRQDTLLVSLMHVNNEIGTIQDIPGYSAVLADHPAYFHMDAAQSFAKMSVVFDRVDLISASGHKIGAPKGVGVLGMRRRKWSAPPLKPLMFGGGQEAGLRPGTLSVHLIAGLGKAVELSVSSSQLRMERSATMKRMLTGRLPVGAQILGDQDRVVPWTLSLLLPGVDSEAQILGLQGIAAVSNGSACTSADYKPSHVLLAMGLDSTAAQCVLRLSWSHSAELGDSEACRIIESITRIALA